MKKTRYNLFFLLLGLLSFVTLSTPVLAQTSWKKCLKDKKGEINVHFYNNPNFIFEENGKMSGMEYEIFELFEQFVASYYEVELQVNYQKSSSFGSLYETVKNGSSGDFGACSFSMTPQRMEEVKFTPKYMPDIEVLISSNDYPVFTDTAQVISESGTFVLVEGTTYEKDYEQIKKYFPNFEKSFVRESQDVKNLLQDGTRKLGFIELPNYFTALKEGYNFKRQNIFKIEREGYGLIYPLESDWDEVMSLFFAEKEIKKEINRILKLYLGEGISDLLLKVNSSYEDEVMLLTKEKELQQQELMNKNLLIKNAALEKAKRESDFAVSEERAFRTQLILIIGLSFLGTLIIVVFIALRNKNKSSRLIQEKNNIVERQLLEISDSIRYAERLQLAILPDKQDLKRNLGEGFVLFRPKDVVSGDFYWMQNIGEKVMYAVADCTGHGVPGAMVSVVCSNALNRSVKEFGLSSPAEILNKARELVIDTFSRSGEDIKDGMDIALCSIKNSVLTYAGANNPLWIIRDVEQPHDLTQLNAKISEFGQKVLIEIKPQKQPIGRHEQLTPFRDQQITLKPNDSVYVFSDGYADQFGGKKGKKFKYKQFKELLLTNNHLNMNQQKDLLNEMFNSWSENYEQVDDVTIIGIRIK